MNNLLGHGFFVKSWLFEFFLIQDRNRNTIIFLVNTINEKNFYYFSMKDRLFLFSIAAI
jgi:hypothetical protein